MPSQVLSGCSRNHAIYRKYFCDHLAYTDMLTRCILQPIIPGLRWTFLCLGCDIWLQPLLVLGYLDFFNDGNRNGAEGRSIHKRHVGCLGSSPPLLFRGLKAKWHEARLSWIVKKNPGNLYANIFSLSKDVTYPGLFPLCIYVCSCCTERKAQNFFCI